MPAYEIRILEQTKKGKLKPPRLVLTCQNWQEVETYLKSKGPLQHLPEESDFADGQSHHACVLNLVALIKAAKEKLGIEMSEKDLHCRFLTKLYKLGVDSDDFNLDYWIKPV